MKKNYAKSLLEKTRMDYNKIAGVFSKTRDYLPADISTLQKYAQPNDKILDLGCGNGRLKKLFGKEINYYGVDFSEELIKIAKTKYPDGEFLVVDGLNLPFPDNFFDKIFCLAVLHHIPSFDIRLKFLKEARRVLKPGGLLILTVWNLWERKKTKPLLIKYTILKLIGKSKLDFKDIFYPWKDNTGKIVINRYFHIFTKKELENLIKRAGFIVKESGVLRRSKKESNIYIIAKKPLLP
jgi:ubiquinone/menaquinone biosynthesis C-methylase UbiE